MMQKLSTTCDDGSDAVTNRNPRHQSSISSLFACIVEWHCIRWIVWIFLFGSCVFMCVLASFYYSFDADYFAQNHYKEESILVYLHILPGFWSQLLGSFQICGPLRRRFIQMHKWFGRIYTFCCFISCMGSFGMSLNAQHGGLSTKLSLCLLTILWFMSTFVGFYHIRTAKQLDTGNEDKVYHIKQHRIWMMRSYALMISPAIARYWLMLFLYAFDMGQTHGFYGDDASRYYYQIRIVEGVEKDEYYYKPEYVQYSIAYTAASWISWVLNVIIAEMYMWLQANHTLKGS